MIHKIKNIIKEQSLFTSGKKILLAISGGIDSVCLFYALRELNYDIELAHCNFKLRGKESDEDEIFIRNLAKKFSVKLHSQSFDIQNSFKDDKRSVQMIARDLRYDWFQEIFENNLYDSIVTAHHIDDNLETFFINLIRGTGVKGLSGIKYKRDNIIRPMILVHKDEIHEYATKNKIKYRVDTSNFKNDYVRNKIRNKIIPLIKEVNPSIGKTISNEIMIFNEAQQIISKYIRELSHKIITNDESTIKINIEILLGFSGYKLVLYEIIKDYGFKYIDKILKAVRRQSGKQFFSSTHKLVTNRKEILIAPIKEKEILEFKVKKTNIDFPVKMRFNVSKSDFISPNINIASFDYNKLVFPLSIRKWKSGDKFIPLGMKKFKKLSDFFIDEKYSILDKENQWILCSHENVIWIIGRRIDERYKIDSKTKKVYLAELLI